MITIRTVIEQGAIVKGDTTTYEEWQERLASIEGGYFDLTLGDVLLPDLYSGRMPFIGKHQRQTRLYRPYKCNSDSDGWTLESGQFLFKTDEQIAMPDGFYADLYPRRTLLTNGAQLFFAAVATGFKGHLFISVHIRDNFPFYIERGAAFMSIRLLPLNNDISLDSYQGIWGGDKACTDGYERAR